MTNIGGLRLSSPLRGVLMHAAQLRVGDWQYRGVEAVWSMSQLLPNKRATLVVRFDHP